AVTRIASQDSINEVAVLSSTQKVYASGDVSEIGKIRTGEGIIGALTTGKTVMQISEQKEEDCFCIILPVLNKPECYDCHIPEEKILGAIAISLDNGPLEYQIRDQSMILALIGGLTFSSLGVVLTLVLRGTITNPLSKLAAAAQRIAKGDFSARAKLETKDEVGMVAHSFNDMAQRVEEALRRSTEFSESVMSSINDGICIINVDDYRIVGVNNAFLEQLGWKEEEVIGKTCYQILYHRSKPCTGLGDECPLLDTVSSNRSSAVDHEYYCANGEKIYVDVSVSPVKDENGKVIRVVHASRDITERKQAEKKEKQLQQELALSSRLAAIGELAAGVAHEINNPLTGIIGFSQRLLRKSTDEGVSRDLDRIHSEAQRAAKVVDSLLTFARRAEPKKEYCDINEIVERTLEFGAYGLKTSNIELVVELTPGLPWVVADFGQIEQVFLNIVLNAEQAMAEVKGGGKLKIRTERGEDRIRISFTDDGPGILTKNLSKIFNPFFTTRGETGGNGLGLSVCHGIVEEHGGKIYVESQPGEGTTFFVELPLI
ncbi:PAS domain-containing sensor histidine kinase, partial [Chloroflexota bacterium]